MLSTGTCWYCRLEFVLAIQLDRTNEVASPNSKLVKGIHLWNARALVAHQRLLQTRVGAAPPSLSQQLDVAFVKFPDLFCTGQEDEVRLNCIPKLNSGMMR